MFKRVIYRKGHPIAAKDGRLRKSRFVLYEKLKGVAGVCHWCSCDLTWKTLCADHLDSNIMNDTEDNLVGSCRGCNANREDGTGHGRRAKRPCKECGILYLSYNKKQIYCSNSCASKNRPKRGITAKHGTRSRYTGEGKCRCNPCKDSNLAYSREHYKKYLSEKCWDK